MNMACTQRTQATAAVIADEEGLRWWGRIAPLKDPLKARNKRDRV